MLGMNGFNHKHVLLIRFVFLPVFISVRVASACFVYIVVLVCVVSLLVGSVLYIVSFLAGLVVWEFCTRTLTTINKNTLKRTRCLGLLATWKAVELDTLNSV